MLHVRRASAPHAVLYALRSVGANNFSARHIGLHIIQTTSRTAYRQAGGNLGLLWSQYWLGTAVTFMLSSTCLCRQSLLLLATVQIRQKKPAYIDGKQCKWH